MFGPDRVCSDWITEDDLCCPTVIDGVDAAVIAANIAAATSFLYDATCRRWPGLCDVTERPIVPCVCGFDWGWWWGNGGWNFSDGWPFWLGCGCSCRRYTRLILPGEYPVTAVTDVRVNGVSLPATDYRLDGSRFLDLQQPNSLGLSWWPRQNPDFPDDTPGTWAVDYTLGSEPIDAAKRAAGDLACHFIASCPSGDCGDLPDDTESVSKRGITIRRRPPGEYNVETAGLLVKQYGCPAGGTPRMIDPADAEFIDRPVAAGP